MRVRKTDRELVDAFVRKRGIKKFESSKARPPSLRIVKPPRRSPRTRK
jgi:hypothetical protein